MPLNLHTVSAREILDILNSPFMEISYSQEGEDRVLQRIFDGKSVGFYVDVGAHHPFRFSNTFVFYMRGWSGVNIDATPGSMALFRKHRPRDINLEHLVGDGDEPLSFTIFDEPALNSTEVGRDAALSDRYTVIERVSIAPRRLDDILDEWLPPRTSIDFLTVDAEGSDLAVLRSNDFTRHRPRIVITEDRSLNLAAPQDNPIYRHMMANGYVLSSKLHASAFWTDAAS